MDGRAIRWKRHNDERRRRIVEAAIALIEEEGAQVSLQAIGERAGLSRSVVYRHFADRRELDVAVRVHILEGLWSQLLPSVELRGTVRETVAGAVGVYVGWAVEHPRLHQLADYDTATDGQGPLQQGIDMIAARIGEIVLAVFELSGAEVSEEDKAAVDPAIYGLVGLIFGTVRRWVHLGEKIPDAAHLTRMLTDTVVAVMELYARPYGIELDPDLPVEKLVANVG